MQVMACSGYCVVYSVGGEIVDAQVYRREKQEETGSLLVTTPELTNENVTSHESSTSKAWPDLRHVACLQPPLLDQLDFSLRSSTSDSAPRYHEWYLPSTPR